MMIRSAFPSVVPAPLALVLVALLAGPPKAGAMPRAPNDFLNLSMLLVKSGEHEDAERLARQGQAKYPHVSGFHLAIGNALAARGRLADAFYEYQWEILRVGTERAAGAEAARRAKEILEKRGPDVDEIRVLIAALQEPDPSARLQRLLSIEKFRGDRFILRMFIAEARARSGDTAGATRMLRGLIERDRFFIPAYVTLSEVLAASGKKKDAAKLLATARDMDPEHWRLKNRR